MCAWLMWVALVLPFAFSCVGLVCCLLLRLVDVVWLLVYLQFSFLLWFRSLFCFGC